MPYDTSNILKASRYFLLQAKSACGANAAGGGGFQPGNTCGSLKNASKSDVPIQKQKATEALANEWYAKREVPDGWYVHGRSGRKDLNTSNVIQMTRDWETAEQYAHDDKGSMWLIRAADDAEVMDFTDEAVRNEVVDRLIQEHKDGDLHYAELDDAVRIAFENSDSEDEAREVLLEQVNPENIVDSAGLFDTPHFGAYLWDKYEPAMAITADGAVVIDVEQVEKAMVTETGDN